MLHVLVWTYYTIAAACGIYMLPGVIALVKRDLAKLVGDREKVEELSKITQKNADEMNEKIKKVTLAPSRFFKKIRKIQDSTFPQQLAQAGAIGRQIKTPQQARQQGNNNNARQSSRSASGASSAGKKTSDDGGGDGDGEPPRLYTYADVARIAPCSVKTIRNRVSAGTFPRPAKTLFGPRFTQQQLLLALAAPTPHKRGRGRPRIAQAMGKGGVA